MPGTGTDIVVKPTRRSRNLVFTSAGDHSNMAAWLMGPRSFDLWITYYGDTPGRHSDVADIYNARKGAKWPNLHHAYRARPDLFADYDSVFVLDDDIIIDGYRIDRLFELRRAHDLCLIQPAFDPLGKNSHPVTVQNKAFLFRYVNFIELGCPLFRTDKLIEFLDIYDPALPDWGVDWWYMNLLMPDCPKGIAVVDSISCINPHDATKPGGREIDRFLSEKERIRLWETMRQKLGLTIWEHKSFGGVYDRPTILRALAIAKVSGISLPE